MIPPSVKALDSNGTSKSLDGLEKLQYVAILTSSKTDEHQRSGYRLILRKLEDTNHSLWGYSGQQLRGTMAKWPIEIKGRSSLFRAFLQDMLKIPSKIPLESFRYGIVIYICVCMCFSFFGWYNEIQKQKMGYSWAFTNHGWFCWNPPFKKIGCSKIAPCSFGYR